MKNISVDLDDWYEQGDVVPKPIGTTDAEYFLRTANETINQRGKDYDQKQERSMADTVTAFNAITGLSLNEQDGWLFMSLLKKKRQYQSKSFHKDSAIDDIAYSALFAECSAC